MEAKTYQTKINYLIKSVVETFPKVKHEYAKSGFIEFENDLKKLLIWFKNHGGSDVPSIACDNIWHTMIIYTEKYFDWCVANYGRVIHHIPAEAKLESCSSCSVCSCSPRVEESDEEGVVYKLSNEEKMELQLGI